MSDSPAGAPPFKDLEAAYNELLRTLWYAAYRFRNEGDGGLEGAKLACHAVAQFIGVRHENPLLAWPFLEIRAAFVDLERGVETPLFSNDVRLKERERSSRRKHHQMLAAVAMEVLMELGTGRKDAAEQVARAVQKWPSFGAQEITGTTVRNWRDQVRRKRDSRNRQFHQLRDHILGQADARAEIRALLRHGPPGVPAA